MAESISPKKIEQATTTTAAATTVTVTPASSKRKSKRQLSEEQPVALSKSKTPKTTQPKQPVVVVSEAEHHLVTALRRIDPLLQFLTRATGLSAVPLATLRAALPVGYVQVLSLTELAVHLQELVARGILHSCRLSNPNDSREQIVEWDSTDTGVGFPPPLTCNVAAITPESENSGGPANGNPRPKQQGSLHGSTKTAAKRRLAALKRSLKQDLVAISAAASSTKNNSQEQQQQQQGTTGKDATVPAVTTTDPGDWHPSVGSSQPKEDSDLGWLLDPKSNAAGVAKKTWSGGPTELEQQDPVVPVQEPVLEEERRARDAIQEVFGFTTSVDDNVVNGDGEEKQSSSSTSSQTMILDRNSLPTRILPKQVAYAGSHPAQDSVYIELDDDTQKQIPPALLRIFGLQSQNEPESNQGNGSGSDTNSDGGGEGGRKLYRHQSAAIQAALSDEHVTICTGTGSGKSLCFLLPVLTAAYMSDRTSLILYPTKALAQDQFSKLQTLLETDADLAERIRPATLDGDCPHSRRVDIAERSNVILTNPDTLHAAILPAWRTMYGSMLARLKYVVIDEAHMYEGVFGAHVAMILSRLVRVNQAAASKQGESPLSSPLFIATSATLPWPEQHFRRLCPISSEATVRVLTSKEDGSPRSEKHFFVWNPPILSSDGTCTGIVSFPRPKKVPEGDKKSTSESTSTVVGQKRPRDEFPSNSDRAGLVATQATTLAAFGDGQPAVAHPRRKKAHQKEGGVKFHRRHAADETAMLLARAVVHGVRCIAFCKTRNLVEWVYERALTYLQNDPQTAHLASKVESYRGGYNMMERRQIERRLFQNELLGVVGTNALELGVDIGGIDLTLHCGYPSSYASLLQQAGRAGRGGARLEVPSCAVVISFNSPSEQQIWRHPRSLLACGVSIPNVIPINSGLVQGHLLCASEEYPLTGAHPISVIQHVTEIDQEQPGLLNDYSLFGGQDTYDEALEVLRSAGSVVKETIPVPALGSTMTLFKAHPSMRKAWSRISIRSIEPVSYSVVDISHPGQGGRMDAIHDERAVMDTLPYSRVFYHAHPGAIITHRGKKYKVLSMTRPPVSVTDTFGGRSSLNLAAFAKPSKDKYATRPLSNLDITVVKQLERAEIRAPNTSSRNESGAATAPNIESPTLAGEFNYTFAGCGAITVKRSVHGYQKLSLITRAELSRTELSLPPLEFDTFGLWIDTEPDVVASVLGDSYGPGVHALSHALLAVAPLFAPGLVRSDLECDHSFYAPTRVMLFDERAGGSSSSERLWIPLFHPNSILDAAVELLEECSSCCWESGYDGGCPACLHASNCMKFNMHLSRSAGAVIGKRIIQRIQETDLYKQFASVASDEASAEGDEGQLRSTQSEKPITPRRKARSKALQSAKEMRSARDRQFVVGRPSWPLDGDDTGFRQVDGD